MTENAGYAGGLLGHLLVTGTGLGLLFLPLPLVALAGVADLTIYAHAPLDEKRKALKKLGDVGHSAPERILRGLTVLGTDGTAWTSRPFG